VAGRGGRAAADGERTRPVRGAFTETGPIGATAPAGGRVARFRHMTGLIVTPKPIGTRRPGSRACRPARRRPVEATIVRRRAAPVCAAAPAAGRSTSAG
jgi:hypothetical protein